jgi:predicted HTH transcriptional regulator
LGYSFAQYVSHERIIEQRKDQYYLALRSSQATFRTQTKPEGPEETIAPWLNFFFSVVKEQADKSIALVEAESHEDIMSPKQNEVLEYLSKVKEAGPAEIVRETGIIMPSVRKSLERLVELGKVKRIGRGRGTRYVKL